MSWLAQRIVRASADPLADEDHWITWRGPIGWLKNAWLSAMGQRTATGKWISSDTALRCSAVWRAVGLLSALPAFLPLKVFRARPDGGADVDREHPAHRLLHATPNPWMTSFGWRQHQGMSLQLRGNSFSALELDRNARVTRILPLHPDQVQVFRDDEGYPVYEVQPADETKQPVRMLHYEMHHLWIHSMNGYTGLSPIEANREGIALALGAEEYGARLFSNGAVMSGILTVPENTSPEAKAEARKSWEKGHKGLANAHKLAVLEAGMDFKPIAMKSVDAQWLEMRKFQIEEIARIFGIPPELLQHTSPVTSWGTGVEQRFIAFLTTTLDPLLVAWEQAMQRDFFYEDELDLVYPRFNRSALLRTDILTRYRVYALARQWGVKNANECRALEDENPIDGVAGETYLDPQNMYLIPPGKDFDDLRDIDPNTVRQLLATLEQGGNHG